MIYEWKYVQAGTFIPDDSFEAVIWSEPYMLSFRPAETEHASVLSSIHVE